MNSKDLEIIKTILQEADIDHIDSKILQIGQHEKLVLDNNRRVNLVSYPDLNLLGLRHIIDSLLLLTAFPIPRTAINVLDIGSGAGFPGIPLNVCFPTASFCYLDSQRKRCAFLKKTLRSLGFNNSIVIHDRLESNTFQSEYNGHFNLILSRAVENFPQILKNSLPLLSKEGILIFYKGPQIQHEISIVEALLTSSPFTFQVLKSVLPVDFPYERYFLVITH